MAMKHMRRWPRLLILMVMATIVGESPTFFEANHIRSGRKANPISLIVYGSGGSNEWSWNYPLPFISKTSKKRLSSYFAMLLPFIKPKTSFLYSSFKA